MRKNKLRELLNEGKPTLGTHVFSPWPGTVELIGRTGLFDYVEFAGEYAPLYDLQLMENLARAVELFDDMTSMIKVDQDPKTYLGIRSIGSGIQNILFTDIRTVEDAQACVAAVRAETPGQNGVHGVGMRRDVGYCYEAATPAYVQALKDSVVSIMIEKRQTMENLEAILDVPGIDMVQFGPGDLSLSLGIPGQYDDPRIIEADERVIREALKRGIAPRIEIDTPDEAKKYLDLGVKHFCIGWDVIAIVSWARSIGEGMRKVLEGA